MKCRSQNESKENARRGTQTFGVHPHLKHLNPGDAITVLPSILRLTRRVTRLPHFGHDGMKAAGISLPVSRQRSLTSCSLRRCHESRSRILGRAPASGRTATSSSRFRSFMAECSTAALSAACGESTPGSGSRNHCTVPAPQTVGNSCHRLVIRSVTQGAGGSRRQRKSPSAVMHARSATGCASRELSIQSRQRDCNEAEANKKPGQRNALQGLNLNAKH